MLDTLIPPPCRVRIGLQANAVPQAGDMPSKFPASPYQGKGAAPHWTRGELGAPGVEWGSNVLIRSAVIH